MHKKSIKNISRLQFITQDYNDLSHLNQIKEALAGGCNWVQLRIKEKSFEEVLETAKTARSLTAKHNAILIINDNVKIAKIVNANGVHLGKNDMSPFEARKILGEQFIIGATANTTDDIETLCKMPIDYLGVGPFKFTTTKKNLSPVIGIEGYENIVNWCISKRISIPMVAIGSVCSNDVQTLISKGMYGVAVSSAIAKSKCPLEACNQLIRTIETSIKR